VKFLNGVGLEIRHCVIFRGDWDLGIRHLFSLHFFVVRML